MYTSEYISKFEQVSGWIQKAVANIYPVSDPDIIKHYIDYRNSLCESSRMFFREVTLSEDFKRVRIHIK